MSSLPLHALALSAAILAGVVLRAPATADDCRGHIRAKIPTGTLAAPAAPCAPAARTTAPQPRDARQKPGTFQRGNTTIEVRGSVRTDISGGR